MTSPLAIWSPIFVSGRWLMLVFWLRPLVLRQVVDVDADFAGRRFRVVDADDDAARIDVVDLAAAARHHRRAAVDGRRALHAGADERLLRAQARHRLALHVRAHQRAVRVVVLEERNQRCGHRHDLRRRHVHVLDLVRRRQHELVAVAARHELVGQLALAVDLRVRLRDHVLAFLDRRQVMDLVGDLAVDDLRYGVSRKPYSLVRAYSASELMRPMFGPSGVSIGHTRP